MIITHNVNIRSVASYFGTVSPLGTQVVDDGGSITITYTTNNKCVAYVYVNNVLTNASSPYTISNISQDMEIYIIFMKPIWIGNNKVSQLYKGNVLIPFVYKGTELVAQYTQWTITWLLTPNISAQNNYTYNWVDNQLWNDTYYWTETYFASSLYLLQETTTIQSGYMYVWDDSKLWSDSLYLVESNINT